MNEKIDSIYRQIDNLDNVIHVLEATANTYYNPKDKMWNVLLSARDKIKKDISKEQARLYKEADKLKEITRNK